MPISPSLSKTVAQIILKNTLAASGGNSKNISATFYYRRLSIVTPPTKIALSNAFLAGPYAALLAAWNVGMTLGSTNIRWFDDALDPTVTTTLAGVGAIGTERDASFNSVFMLMQTGIRGRQYRGSKHFAGVNAVDAVGDVLTGAGLTRWQAAQTALIAPLTDATTNVWNPCVVSLSLSTYRSNPTSVLYNDTTAIILDLTLGTMRKRKVRTVV